MNLAFRSKWQRFEPKFRITSLYRCYRAVSPLWKDVNTQPGFVSTSCIVSGRHLFAPIVRHKRSDDDGLRLGLWSLPLHGLCGTPSGTLARVFGQRADSRRSPLVAIPRQEIPSRSSFVKNNTTCLKSRCSFHEFLSEHRMARSMLARQKQIEWRLDRVVGTARRAVWFR